MAKEQVSLQYEGEEWRIDRKEALEVFNLLGEAIYGKGFVFMDTPKSKEKPSKRQKQGS